MQNNHILQSLVQSNTFKYYRVLVGRGNLYFSSPVIARQDRDDVDFIAGLRETPVLTAWQFEPQRCAEKTGFALPVLYRRIECPYMIFFIWNNYTTILNINSHILLINQLNLITSKAYLKPLPNTRTSHRITRYFHGSIIIRFQSITDILCT